MKNLTWPNPEPLGFAASRVEELFVAQDLVMSDFSLTLVLQIKTSKIINDMAKVQQKSEKITAFGGIFFVLDKFDSILSSVIDSHLGLRSRLIGYQSAR